MLFPSSLWTFPLLDMVQKAHVRGKAVVDQVLDAVIQELCEVGYTGLRYERVAERAGVNRTTLYRRWATKPDLVRDAVLAMQGAGAIPPETGSLRGDLMAMCQRVAAFAQTPEGIAVMRLFTAQTDDPELSTMLTEIREAHDAMAQTLLATIGLEGDALETAAQVFPAAFCYRVIVVGQPIDTPFITHLVDLLIGGAQSVQNAQT